MKKGKLVTFEGGEGAGKSTIMRRVCEQLQGDGHETRMTHEPGGWTVGMAIRRMIFTLPEDTPNPEIVELFLFLADRAGHYGLIEKLLERCDLVLCDRGPASTIAYQSGGRGINEVELLRLNTMATRGRKSDLTILLDGDPETLLKRGLEPNRFESEDLSFHRRVRQSFLDQRTDYWTTIDATQSEDTVFKEALAHIRALLK